jgi:hypothetical protein
MKRLDTSRSKTGISDFLPLVCFLVFIIAEAVTGILAANHTASDAGANFGASIGFLFAAGAAIAMVVFSIISIIKSFITRHFTIFTLLGIVLVLLVWAFGWLFFIGK